MVALRGSYVTRKLAKLTIYFAPSYESRWAHWCHFWTGQVTYSGEQGRTALSESVWLAFCSVIAAGCREFGLPIGAESSVEPTGALSGPRPRVSVILPMVL